MIIGFGGIFLLIFIMFESFGVTEYVWPIMFPILAATFGIMTFVLLILGLACRTGGWTPTERMVARETYTQPTFPSYDIPSTGAVYVVPLYCPHCMNKLELDKVEWVGSTELSCPNCFSIVQVGVRENF